MAEYFSKKLVTTCWNTWRQNQEYPNKNFEGHKHLQPPTCNVAIYWNNTV